MIDKKQKNFCLLVTQNPQNAEPQERVAIRSSCRIEPSAKITPIQLIGYWDIAISHYPARPLISKDASVLQ
jgi:hypothetical protein